MAEGNERYSLSVNVQSWNPPSAEVTIYNQNGKAVINCSGEEADTLIALLNADLSEDELRLALAALGFTNPEIFKNGE